VPDIFRNLREMNRADAIEYVESLVAYLSNTSREIKEEVIVEAMNEAFPVEELGTVAPFARTWIARWKAEGMSSLTLRMVRHRFPAVEAATLEQIQALPIERLEEFGEALLDFDSLDDLDKWLADNSSPAQVM
jgi:hypothetical protein